MTGNNNIRNIIKYGATRKFFPSLFHQDFQTLTKLCHGKVRAQFAEVLGYMYTVYNLNKKHAMVIVEYLAC